MTNLLDDVQDVLTFDQYTLSDFWTGTVDEDGYPILSAEIETLADLPYSLTFSMAANLAADAYNVTIDVTFDGELIGSFDHTGATFIEQEIDFTGTGDIGTLEFRIRDNTSGNGEQDVDTTGVVPSYATSFTFGGQVVEVDAFLPGQGLIYQVLGGQLNVFDPTTNTYTETEYQNDFAINAMGYSAEFDLIFGHARADGVDSVGNTVSNGDLVAFDARGATYKVAETDYSHYIGDFDDQGYLWTFDGGLNIAVRYDLSQLTTTGEVIVETYGLPDTLARTSGLADLAYDAETQTFYGVAHGGADGAQGTLFAVDISQLSVGNGIAITETAIVGTLVDGEIETGIARSAYGAMAADAEGNIYAGANNANHDLDDSTDRTGGFYKVVTGEDGALYLELLADAPSSSNNDGAMDARGLDPFLGVDTSSTVLLREPVVSLALAEDDTVRFSAKGDAKTIDLLANDYVSEGESLTLTTLNGAAATAGMTLTLSNGETATYNGDGTITISPDSRTSNVSASFTYSIVNDRGVEDTATVSVFTSPVDGTAEDDQMITYADSDGDEIDGADGDNDVILGYGGNDKIFAYAGDDDIYGGLGDDFIRGGAGDDLVDGGDGNDVVDGGIGNDTMIGGDGDDVYYIYDEGDVLQGETGGYDKVKSAYDHTLADPFEELWLIEGSDALTGTGNASDNKMVGNELGNTFWGLDGRDNIDGREGDDTLYGGAGADNLYGREGDDLLDGGAGDDKLEGDEGQDELYGAQGDDTLNAGAGDDLLEGGDGNDVLGGGLGADTMRGGDGDDVYYVDDALDVVSGETGGYDKVISSLDHTLGDDFEELWLASGSDALTGVGNDADNKMLGNGAGNTLSGLGGADSLQGLGGDDFLYGGDGTDDMRGGDGNDTMDGGADADKLRGGSGDDVLDGGAGSDVLVGDAGSNIITGGTGDDRLYTDDGYDTFVFYEGDGQDAIKDFDWETGEIQIHAGADTQVSLTSMGSTLVLDYGDIGGDMIYLYGLGDLDHDLIDYSIV